MNEPTIVYETSSLAMATDDDLDPLDPAQVDTLTAADVVRRVSVDDALLGRDLKGRMFGKTPAVRIGRYEVLSRIGRGGMGTVYLARDPELDRTIALKVLREDRHDGNSRMLNEARALARLTHPNVVTVHEVGTHEGRVFLAMEFIEGPTLRAWLEHERSAEAILDAFAQAAAGLAAAHRVGLVHRDFKPENVIIGSDGRVRVVDFGVAKAPGEGAAASADAGARTVDLTQTGQLLGTPAYMAAEQFLGSSVDRRADVFALCVALHEAFAGERPFAGDDALAVCRAVTKNEARPLESEKLPRSLAPLLRRGLSADRELRPTLDELLVELRPHVRRAPQRPRALRAGAFALAMIAGVGAYKLMRPPGHAAEQTAQTDQYAALIAATDDDERVRLAEEFLATFGELGDPARRAVAHAIIGHVLWDLSCDQPWMGLCVEAQPIAAGPHCRPPTRGRLLPRARTAAAEVAQEHFVAATQLAGISVPDDEALADAWRDAVGGSRVRVADHDLEQYLVTDIPAELDFETSDALSRSAFTLFLDRVQRDGAKLVAAYAEVKGTTAKWQIVAGARTGLLYESIANTFASHSPTGAQMDTAKVQAYCDALDAQVIGSFSERGRNACTWSTDKALQSDLVGLAEASGCSPRTGG